MIIGLDISTSITGCTIIDGERVVINDAWDTRKYKDFFEKAQHVEKEMEKLYSQYGDKITAIYIEQSLQSFRSGFSSAKTLSTLSRFNGVVSWFVYSLFKIKPEYIAASSARKLCGIKIPRGQKAKTVVLNYLLENEETFQVEYTKFGNPRPESYDKADSLIIAKAGYHLSKENKK
tara:strand:+ start:14778 stop:15305 length:528 start_codon:yes stop_codon:yes gene_type:complete